MITTNEVYRKIKEISLRTPNPRPLIAVAGIASELQQVSEQIVPMLTELKDMRLIAFDKPNVQSIKLSLLCHTVKLQRT
jgi:hypothetical protein